MRRPRPLKTGWLSTKSQKKSVTFICLLCFRATHTDPPAPSCPLGSRLHCCTLGVLIISKGCLQEDGAHALAFLTRRAKLLRRDRGNSPSMPPRRPRYTMVSQRAPHVSSWSQGLNGSLHWLRTGVPVPSRRCPALAPARCVCAGVRVLARAAVLGIRNAPAERN